VLFRSIASTVIEMNLETVHALRARNVAVVYGDAGRFDTLDHAGTRTAEVMVLSASDVGNGREIIRQARLLNPRIRILARTTYLRDAGELRAAGADGVFSGEGEVALAMTESILNRFNATPEQIRIERERVKQELHVSPPSGVDTGKSAPI